MRKATVVEARGGRGTETSEIPPPPLPISRFSSHHLTEADLVHLWEGQRFPPAALQTATGVPLRAIYRGRRTGSAGPDFRDAIIAAPGGLMQGDVELHVRSSDFRRHGHHLDHAYDTMALHLVFHHDAEGDTELASGRRVPVVALADWVSGRAGQIRRWLERPASWEEPCRSAAGRLGPEAAGAALDRLGDLRFRVKTAAFAVRVREAGADQALWEGICETLGYGGRRELLRSLALRTPWVEMAAELAGLSGARRAAAAESLLRKDMGEGRQPPEAIATGRPWGRPGNGLAARLRGAAALAARFARRGPWEALRPPVEARELGHLVASLSVAGAVGRSRAIETVANAVLPCAAATGLEAPAEALYRRLPLPARYGAVRHLHTALGDAVAMDARRQQGMLYLLREYCTRGGCGRCVLS